MNQGDSFRAITRREIRVDYQSPLICIEREEASGSASSSSALTFLPVVQVPGPLLSVSVEGADAALTWSVVGGAYAYVVYRATAEEGPYAILLAGTVETSFVDTPPGPGTYYYKVSAIEPNYGASELSNAVSATV